GVSPSSYLFKAGGLLYFAADDGVHGVEIWRSDGTAAGTYLLKDIVPGSGGIYGRFLAASNNQMLFAVNDGTHASEPVVPDGSDAGTLMLAALSPGPSSSIDLNVTTGLPWDAAPAPWGGFLFAADDGTGRALWRTDGTPGGTARISAAGSPHEMVVFQGAVYF